MNLHVIVVIAVIVSLYIVGLVVAGQDSRFELLGEIFPDQLADVAWVYKYGQSLHEIILDGLAKKK